MCVSVCTCTRKCVNLAPQNETEVSDLAVGVGMEAQVASWLLGREPVRWRGGGAGIHPISDDERDGGMGRATPEELVTLGALGPSEPQVPSGLADTPDSPHLGSRFPPCPAVPLPWPERIPWPGSLETWLTPCLCWFLCDLGQVISASEPQFAYLQNGSGCHASPPHPPWVGISINRYSLSLLARCPFF